VPDPSEPTGDASWLEWRRVLFADIRRIGEDVRSLDRELRDVASDVKLLKAALVDVNELEARVAVVEARLAAGVQRNEDRKWLIGLAVLVVASILFPSLRVVLFGGSG
jgi:hypothetical protein